MPRFSQISLQRLATCDERLQHVCHELIKIYDVKVISGRRGEAEQNRLVEQGRSQLRFPKSKHNSTPSKAVDLAPYPIDWEDTGRFLIVAGLFFGIAAHFGIHPRWGGTWNRNLDKPFSSFWDPGHFEL